jgi:hypothetical protein
MYNVHKANNSTIYHRQEFLKIYSLQHFRIILGCPIFISYSHDLNLNKFKTILKIVKKFLW